jgi:hypothetical protein
MVTFLYTAREHHGVNSAEEYAARHASFLAKKRARGMRFDVHESEGALVARVDANSWIVDCECGAGNATAPDWGVAYCFSCGAIHRAIVFPGQDNCDLIEAVLVERVKPMTRGWDPDQTLVDLVAENVFVGIDVPDIVIEAIAAAPVIEAPGVRP